MCQSGDDYLVDEGRCLAHQVHREHRQVRNQFALQDECAALHLLKESLHHVRARDNPDPHQEGIQDERELLSRPVLQFSSLGHSRKSF